MQGLQDKKPGSVQSSEFEYISAQENKYSHSIDKEYQVNPLYQFNDNF